MCDGLAGEEGFEPPWTVLETGILPLYDSPIWFWPVSQPTLKV